MKNLGGEFSAEWLEAKGLPVAAQVLSVGDICPNSYRWEDGDLTGEQLEGASAIRIASEDDIETAISKLSVYGEGQIVLLESATAFDGEDAHEIVMVDARVVRVIR